MAEIMHAEISADDVSHVSVAEPPAATGTIKKPIILVDPLQDSKVTPCG